MKVFVVVMSAPAARYCSWIERDELGPRQVQEVGVAGNVERVVAKALAAVVLGRETGPVEHRSPRTVEHEDPLAAQAA